MSESGPDSVEVLLNIDDYVAAQAMHTRWTRKRAVVLLCSGAVGIVVGGFVPSAWAFAIGFTLVGCAVGGAIGFEFARRFVIPKRARRIFAQQKALRRSRVYHWDDTGLRSVSEHAEGTMPWTDFLKQRESDRLYLLYLSDAMFVMMPKRVFQDHEHLRSFAARVRHIPAA